MDSLRIGSHRRLGVDLSLKAWAQLSPNSTEVSPAQAREQRNPGTDQSQAPEGESEGWVPGLWILPPPPVPPPTVASTHPPCCAPSSRKHQALLWPLRGLGQPDYEGILLAQGPVVPRNQQVGWQGVTWPPAVPQ